MAPGLQNRKADLGSWGTFLLAFAIVSVLGTALASYVGTLRPALMAAWLVVLAIGLSASMLIATLKRSPWTARAAAYLFAGLLLSLSAPLLPAIVPRWILAATLVVFVAASEERLWAFGISAACGLLSVATLGQPTPKALAASVVGFTLFGGAASLAFSRSRARLSDLRATIARLRHGAEFADEDLATERPRRHSGPVERMERATGAAIPATARFHRMLRALREDARTGRDVERAQQLEHDLAPMLRLARLSTQANAALLFTIDPGGDTAFLRAALGPDNIKRDAHLDAHADPIAFVVDRRRVFYATDFRGLLWSLPYYSSEVRVGTLLAAPVIVRGLVAGVLVVDHLETQAFADREQAVVEIATLAAHVIQADRETLVVEEQRLEFEAAGALSQKLALITEIPEIHAFVAASIHEMAPKTIASGLLRIQGDSIEPLPGASETLAEWVGVKRSLSERTWLTWHVASGAEPCRIDTWTERPQLPLFKPGGGFPGDSLLLQPLRFRNRLVGVLIAVGERGAFEGPLARVLAVVANQAAAAIALVDMIDANRSLALHDALTGLLNRRAFDETFSRAMAHALRSGQPASLVMIDLDRFKSLNDEHGHLVGDRALQSVAEELLTQVRGGDLAARYGGEEFALILPGTDGANAFRMAERVRKGIEARRFMVDGEHIPLTASLGIAATDQGYTKEDEMIRAADEALYASKQTGRNRSSLASGLRA